VTGIELFESSDGYLNEEKVAEKKLAALRSKKAAKYHLQTAITPFALITYFYQVDRAISKRM